MNYLTVTKKESYLAFQDEKKNVETIAKERNIVLSTVTGHLGLNYSFMNGYLCFLR
jgi:hypothetical protein